MFLAGSIVGTYGLVLYEAFPRYLFDINYSLYYFVIPASAVASVLVALPRFLGPKEFASKAQPATEVDPLSEIIGGGSADATTTGTPEENLDISKIGGSNAELDALLAGGAPQAEASDTVTTEVQPAVAAGFDETKIRELIDQKFEPVEKDLTTFKKDLNKIKEDMKITKESVDTLTESFEGTLTDMKAFQAEISNPLNFMRKYFEALDLTNLSDPSLPLKQGILHTAQTNQNSSQPTNPPQVAAPQANQVPIIIQAAGNANAAPPQNIPSPVITGSEMDRLVKGTDLDNPMNSVMKPLFSGNLSVANMMAIIELVGEMFAEKGEDCIDLLVEQCKLMGLKPEDEHTIYNIIDMLKNSGMSTEEAISQLYRFSKIVGLNDKEADAYYARMSAQKRKREARD
ncbi:MAG: hypothetical protein QW177_01810 [Candidatus Nitrosotenuis sp.]